MGAAGGGVWKTENAGITWQNISDGFFNVGTIGSIAVAHSDPNVIYVGTGEGPIRGVTTSHGDGVYKSTDAGKTWAHVGLEKAGQIPKIRVHPTNSDIAWVAVQGQIWGPSEERGIYRTEDGGKTWQHVLKIGDRTGGADLAVDPTNPRILYASLWNHGRSPWFVHSGGTDGGIYKSTDGGDTWKKLTGGLPEMVGKIGVDVAASSPNQLYAIVEAHPGEGGLWHSNDYGESWTLVNEARIIQARAWYYNHIKVDPNDPNSLFVMNAPLMRSIDGGKTFEKRPAPHSDHHDMWINPDDSLNMINANDGGATITFDGGDTWSSIMNQPTAQFYRVITDNQTPFRIYGGQQDNTTVAIASRSRDGGIGHEDYFAVGGGESAHIAFDEENPRVIYATTINSTLTEHNVDNNRQRLIMPYPEYVFGHMPKNLRYRTNWNAPVMVSQHSPDTIYYGTDKLLRSTNRGVDWAEVSPDLTRNDKSKQDLNGGPITNEQVGAEYYGTIFYVAESPHAEGELWIGSDDGLIHVSRDGGENWQNVTPRRAVEGQINAIEISPHTPGTAYVALAAYKMNDFSPYIYKTENYGRSWTRLDGDLPKDTFVRVVREDPDRKGLLYAGTEAGMFVSFDDGKNWQSFAQNLPPVPITDLTLRQGSLVAATQGRGFWLVDDLSVMHQVDADMAKSPLHVFTPRSASLESGGGGAGKFEGPNPKTGAAISYYLPEDSEERLTIDILNAAGDVIRTFHDGEGDFERCILGNEDPRIPISVSYPTKKAGLNTWHWDLRRTGMHCIPDIRIFAGFDGARVIPGTYQARVNIGDVSQTVGFDVIPDPRVEASDAEYQALDAYIEESTALMNDVLQSLEYGRTVRARIATLMTDHQDNPALQAMGMAATDALAAWDHSISQVYYETYEDEDSWPALWDVQIRFIIDVFDYAGLPIASGTLERFNDLKDLWAAKEAELAAIRAQHVSAINAWASANAVTPLP